MRRRERRERGKLAYEAEMADKRTGNNASRGEQRIYNHIIHFVYRIREV